jgi:hypothetical protein
MARDRSKKCELIRRCLPHRSAACIPDEQAVFPASRRGTLTGFAFFHRHHTEALCDQELIVPWRMPPCCADKSYNCYVVLHRPPNAQIIFTRIHFFRSTKGSPFCCNLGGCRYEGVTHLKIGEVLDVGDFEFTVFLTDRYDADSILWERGPGSGLEQS